MMNSLSVINQSKSEESFLHKEPTKGGNTSPKKLSDSISASPILLDSQNTNCSTATNIASSYLEFLLSLGPICLSKSQKLFTTNINVKNLNLEEENKEKKREDLGENSENNYIGKKRKILFKSVKKKDDVNLFKTYQYASNTMKFNMECKRQQKKKIFKINKNIETGINDGRWSYNEHIKFIEAVVKFGKNWSNIAKYLGTRTPNQVRSHSQKFYFKLRDIKNNELNINFQNRNIKNIFDIIYLIKERKKSNDDENEYVINTLISLTKNLNYNFLKDLYKNKIEEQNKDIINVNKKDVFKIFKNDIKAIEDPEKKIDDSKKIETDINEKLINNNIKEKEEQKEEKITLDNNINDINIFKIKVEESEDENVGEEKEESENEKAEEADKKEEAEEELEEREVEKEEEIPYEYIYPQENQKYIFVDGILFPENALNFSDMINLDYKKRNFM